MKIMYTPIYPCLGALIGDTVGSVYEFDNIKTTDFPLFSPESNYTDDSIMTIAVADWLANTDRSQAALEEKMVAWAKQYPCPLGGYGGFFSRWLFAPQLMADYEQEGMTYQQSLVRHPYNSWFSLDDNTEFDAENKTITNNFYSGCCEWGEFFYRVDDKGDIYAVYSSHNYRNSKTDEVESDTTYIK